jgi:hypothetical protein
MEISTGKIGTQLDSELPMELNDEKISAADLEITTARSLDEIENVRSIWEQMQHDEPYPVPNADINRYIASMKAVGEDAQPYIIVIKCMGRPVAMTIGRIEKRPVVFKLGYKTLFRPMLRSLSIVYGGVIGRPSSDLCAVLVGELINALRRREADMVFLNHLRVDSPMYRLCSTMPHVVTRGHFVPAQPHWQTCIPRTVDEFYDGIPNSRKHKWRRDIRNLEKMSASGIQMVCYRQLGDVDHVIAVVCDIEKSTYKKGLEVGFTDSVLNRALLEQADRDGWLRAYVLYAGGEPCAFQLDVHYGKTQFTEYGSFDPRWRQGSPGIVLLVKVLDQLCGESQVRAMDYGFGGASYKEKFGTKCWLEKSVYIYAPRVRPVLVNMAMTANLTFCEVLRRATVRLQLDSWVKRRWRRMLRTSGQKEPRG